MIAETVNDAEDADGWRTASPLVSTSTVYLHGPKAHQNMTAHHHLNRRVGPNILVLVYMFCIHRQNVSEMRRR